MERKTRSGKIVSSPNTVVVETKVPGKRGRKKKSEIIESEILAQESQQQIQQQGIRRSLRGRNANQSDHQSLNESTLSQSSTTIEEDSNVSSITINDDSNDSKIKTESPEKSESFIVKDAHQEILMKTLEIKLVDCCLQEKQEVSDEQSSDVEMQASPSQNVSVDNSKEKMEIDIKEEVVEEIIKIETQNDDVVVAECLKDEKVEEEEIVEIKDHPPICEEKIEETVSKKNDNIEETVCIETPNEEITPLVKEEEVVKIEVENVKNEFKFEPQDEEVSFLRRSRRLKSIYTENPIIVTKSEELSKDTSAVSSPETSKIKTKVKDALEATPDDQSKSQEDILIPAVKSESVDDPILSVSQCDERLSQFVTIKDNIYMKSSEKVICKVNKTMKCDCTITEEDLKNGEMGCRYNCINRLLFIECSEKCRLGKFCDNQQFQRHNYAPVSVFRTEKKGFGIRADADIPPETFIIEYVGEVLNNKQFDKRAKKYSKDKNRHYYFMALRSNAIIDATTKGNISRFINHSCDPNAMTQKWTVNGELRVGFFSIRDIRQGEEITFDYQFQRYGKEAQKCYCESEKCRGWIGENPMSEEEEEEEVEAADDSKPKKGRGAKKAIVRKTKTKVGITDEDDEEEIDKEQDADNEKENENQEEVKKEDDAADKFARKTKKRQEFFDDLEIEEEINDLIKSGLKNRAHTIRLARLVVRAKNTDARSRLMKILITGDFPCRRLFLDYNGLRLLHNWMCDISVKSSIPDLYLCIELMSALDLLPITNKTVLRDSKILERVEKWKNLDLEKKKLSKEEKKQAKADKKKSKANKQQIDTSLEAKEDSAISWPIIRTFDVLEELPTMKLIVKETAAELLKKWEVLKEDFRIPKKQKQEIMIEHEREAGMEDWQNNSTIIDNASNERYKNRFGEDSFSANNRNIPAYKKTIGPMERQQRRQMYAMKMAQEEMEKRMNLIHENNCALFGLPSSTHPLNIPYRVNRVTGEYCNIMGATVPIPPNHQNFKYEPLTLSTNPDDYILPPIDLPPHWKYAIDKFGRIYYYHEKIRQPQWEAPIKILPLNVDSDIDDINDIDSDESITSTEDSEEEELRELLEMLKKKKLLASAQSSAQVNSSDLNVDEDELEKKIMNNMLTNPMMNQSNQSIKLSPLPVRKRLKKKSRKNLQTMKFIRPRTEDDKLYGRTETKRYKEVKEKLRRDKKRRMLLGESAANMSDEEEEEDNDSTLDESRLSKMVDELDLLNKSKQFDKMRKIKKDVDIDKRKESPSDPSKLKKPKPVMPTNVIDQTMIKRQFRDEIKEEITKFLLPYYDAACVNGRITCEDDYISLINKLTFSVLTKESKHCAQSNSILKATDSVKGKTKEYIKKYMAKFEGAYMRKHEEQDYANILNKM